MGFATAVMVGLGAMQVGASIASGYAKKNEANYNASLIDQTAPLYDANQALVDTQKGLVEKNKQLELYQTNRQIGQVMGTTRARTAGKGITLSGSPMAIMLDTYKQMEIDKRINQSNYDMQKYNLDIEKYNIAIEKNRALSQAAAYRRQASTSVFTGYTNAFTSALQTGVNYGLYTGGFDTKNYANVSGIGRVNVAPPNYYLRAGKL